MFNSLPLLFLTISVAALGACAPETTSEHGDLALEHDVSGIGKADHLSIDFEEIQASISREVRSRGGQAIVTSAESFSSDRYT